MKTIARLDIPEFWNYEEAYLSNITLKYDFNTDAKAEIRYDNIFIPLERLPKITYNDIEELIDDFDSKVWSYIRTIDNREAKDILARISKEIMDEYLGEEE